jgi:hypothetical protein
MHAELRNGRWHVWERGEHQCEAVRGEAWSVEVDATSGEGRYCLEGEWGRVTLTAQRANIVVS